MHPLRLPLAVLRLPGRVALAAFVLVLAAPAPAYATCFCMMFRRPPATVTQSRGITSDPAYNPTSAVFLVRDGTRTTLTIEAAYQGPSKEVAMVIPIPQAVTRDQVRTIEGSVFRNLDRRTAPKVEHVWPACRRRPRPSRRALNAPTADGFGGGAGSVGRIEAIEQEYQIDIVDEWEVQEYDITLLGADQSAGLLRYLVDEGLDLPPEADGALRAYIQGDFRFVLAKVDPSRAHQLGDRMMLSPIQIEYESDQLQVPVRLGTLNSPGEQELLLYVLAKDGRYEIANRTNVVAPSQLRLRESAAGSVAELYEALMDETFRRTPGAAVTEYAHTLGSRVGRFHVQKFGIPSDREARRMEEAGGRRGRWTLTRIRHRYGKELDDDLTLRPASEPLRMRRRWGHPELSVWAPRGQSGFHVQFAVIHEGGACPSTARQQRLAQQFATAESMWAASDTPWPGDLLRDDVPALGITAGSPEPSDWGRRHVPTVAMNSVSMQQGATTPQAATEDAVRNVTDEPLDSPLTPEQVRALQGGPAPAAAPEASGCGGCQTGGAPVGLFGLLLLVFGRRRRRD